MDGVGVVEYLCCLYLLHIGIKMLKTTSELVACCCYLVFDVPLWHCIALVIHLMTAAYDCVDGCSLPGGGQDQGAISHGPGPGPALWCTLGAVTPPGVPTHSCATKTGLEGGSLGVTD